MKEKEVLEALERLRQGLMAVSTNGSYNDSEFKNDVSIVISDSRVEKMIPSSVKQIKTTSDYFRLMQAKFKSYHERREFINSEFEPSINYLESVVNGTDKFTANIEAYQLSEEAGHGGYGTVYKYLHKLLNYTFAIKIFEPVFVSNEENIEGENRFFREAKILFQLNHDKIVKVYDIGRIEGKPFIRMEYIDGKTLQDIVSQNGTVSFDRSKKPIQSILSGLSHAHKQGIIHRDLKPTNIMFTRENVLKIIDFGISAFLETENHTKLTKTGESIAGGPYTDPMLLENPKLRDIRSDIYSVGAIWYYLLVGTSPAGADIQRKLTDSGKVTKLQSDIILRCLESNLENRYQSCEELMNYIFPSDTRSQTNAILTLGDKITEITREAIFDYLSERHNEDLNAYVYSQNSSFQEPEKVFYYWGRKGIIVFLNRLYNLQSMPTLDKQLITFEDEIQRHVISNDDYEYCWVFHDERLGLKTGNDETLLRFVCEMFHPLIRSEKSDWQDIKNDINTLLNEDGYEIYECEKISGRAVYSYRCLI